MGSMITLYRANRVVRRRLDTCTVNDYADDERLRHSQDILDSALNASTQRLERIENKAMATLLGIGVAIAVLSAAIGLLGSDGLLADRGPSVQLIAAALLLITMLFLLSSGLLALGAYRIGPVYRPTLLERAPVVESLAEAKETIFCIEQNDRAANLRSNKLAGSFACLRNGLTAVLGLGVFILALHVPIGVFRSAPVEQPVCPPAPTETSAPEEVLPPDALPPDTGNLEEEVPTGV